MQRRTLLKNLGGLALLPALPAFATAKGTPAKGALAEAPALRVAHITDVHLKDFNGAPGHFRDCLHNIQRQDHPVDFILNGGDIVFDMNKENLDVIDAQWNLMSGIMRAECSLPVHYILGNHDVWWNEQDKGQVLYGKQYSMEKLQLPKAYYSFEKNGWKFILLDSVHLDIDDTWYIGKLGDEQFQWLQGELESARGPVLIMSHIPILTSTVLLKDDVINRWEITGGEMHTDSTKLIRLFNQYPNVKLVLSGHIHLREKLVYDNLTFLCNGAVSGKWWAGVNRETRPGYGLIDLYPDGTFQEQYINY